MQAPLTWYTSSSFSRSMSCLTAALEEPWPEEPAPLEEEPWEAVSPSAPAGGWLVSQSVSWLGSWIVGTPKQAASQLSTQTAKIR